MARRPALFLTPRLPWPLDDGGRIVGWQALWAAAQDHDVTMISFVPEGSEREPVPSEFAKLGVAVERVAHRPPPLPAAAARGLFGQWPYTLARYQSQEFERLVRSKVAALRPAYAIANHLHMAPYVDALGTVPMVLREHNVEHVWMERYARERGFGPAGLYAALQTPRLWRAEAFLCRAAALVLAIQDREAAALRVLAPDARVETLPVGIDLDRYPPASPVHPPVVLLAASFAWPPNATGALRFLEKGWPRVKASVPDARLRIAGKTPPAPLVEAARRAGAEVAANVPSMPDEFARATLLVVPLWAGAGARVKIVEALAARLPVVSTPLGAEGLDLDAGTHYLHAETPGEMGDAAALLIQDGARRANLAEAGRALAEKRWSLQVVAARQSSLIAAALDANPVVASTGNRG